MVGAAASSPMACKAAVEVPHHKADPHLVFNDSERIVYEGTSCIESPTVILTLFTELASGGDIARFDGSRHMKMSRDVSNADGFLHSSIVQRRDLFP